LQENRQTVGHRSLAPMVRPTENDVEPTGAALEEFAALHNDVVDDAIGLRLLSGEPTVAL
jgi:hypothetical protein